MKSKTKKLLVVGGVLGLLYFLFKKKNQSKEEAVAVTEEPQIPNKVTPPKIDRVDIGYNIPASTIPTPPYQSPPFIPQSSGSGTGGMVTNNQTVPQNYNPRDYGDVVLGSVDRGGNILR